MMGIKTFGINAASRNRASGGGNTLPDPTGWWKFDDGSGTNVADFIGSRNGTIDDNGGTSTWGTGELTLEGGAYINFQRIVEFEDDADFTFSVDIKWLANTSACLWGYSNNDTIGEGAGTDFYCYWTATPTINAGISSTGVEVTSSITDFNDGNWHRLTFAYHDGILKLYDNGTLKDTFGTISAFHFGNMNDGTWTLRVAFAFNITFLECIIRDMRVWNQTLNDAQVALIT